ncbi:MAG TPA: phage major capsid protein, partial [Candidatus Bathyarchaeia archaeon]|nr:phage major capsid protein [Candidatus Bathyarchaeia archaeon]
MYVKILKAVDDLEIGKTYEVEDEDGAAYIEAEQAEATEFEEVPDLAGAIKAGIGDAVKSALADALAKAKPSGIIVGNDRKALDPNGGYKHVGQFLYDVVRAGTPNSPTPKRLIDYMATCKVAGHMAEGDDSQGGFLVPTGFLPQLQMDKIMETGLAGRCTKIPMVTNAVSIPYVNQTTHATSVYGGLIVYRTGESELKAVSKPT